MVNGMYRGKEVALEEWHGGDDLALAPGDPWPVADVHNAREAAWARTRSAEEVLGRWDRAHERLLTLVTTVTEEEARRDEYFGKIAAAHLRPLCRAPVRAGGVRVEVAGSM